MTLEHKKIGTVGVDSGHVVIVDPAMADQLQNVNWQTGNEWHKEIKFPSAVCSVAGYGDGDYSVYEVTKDGEYLGLMIWFDDEVDFINES